MTPVYQGKAREEMLKIVGGENKWSLAATNKWYYNPSGPFKWKVNSAGWVYVAKPSVLKVSGAIRFGWKVFRVERDGMMKQTDFQAYETIEEAMSKFNALNDRVHAVEQNTGKVLNMAKFKVGDKVKLIGASPVRDDFHSGVGKVTKVMERGSGAGYHVLFDDGREFPFVESQLVSANSCAVRNAVKVGDYCTIKSGIRCKESGKTGQIVDLGEINGRQTFVMKMADGHTFSGFVDSFIDNSSNSRAANARSFAVFDGQPVRDLRWNDALSCLDEIKARAVRDWHVRLPAVFQLTCGGGYVGQFKIDENGNVYRNSAVRSCNTVVQRALNAAKEDGSPLSLSLKDVLP